MKNLTDALSKMALSLKASGKPEVAGFFDGIRNRLETAPTVEESKSIAKEITTAAAITQYGGFDADQDRLFDACYVNAKAFISTY